MNSCFQSCTHHLSIPCSNIHNTWAHQFLNCIFNVSCLMLLKDTSKKKKRKKKKTTTGNCLPKSMLPDTPSCFFPPNGK